MALPLYLAMTPAEMGGNTVPSPFLAYMACHFSPCGSGLSNCPDMLPPGSMLILNDSSPMDGHDPSRILKEVSAQMEKHRCRSLLLDFQRPGIRPQAQLARLLAEQLPCPVGVSELYARELSCPVFLPPVPPDVPIKEHLNIWTSREIWLDAALDGVKLTLTESGCIPSPLLDFPEQGMQDDKLHCHYIIESPAVFRLWRTREDLDALLKEAESLGIAMAVGLWQELRR